MLTATPTETTTQTWLRNKRFDLSFILGIPLVGITSAAIVAAKPDLFHLVLVLDVWLLGYHHVISTFSRLCATKESIQENIGLLTVLPVVVFGLVALTGTLIGPWVITTTYLYWQWFHYTRQSWGVARVLERKADLPLPENQRFFVASFWLLPLWGILHRSHQNPDEFLGSEVWTFPVPALVVNVVAALAIASVVGLVVTRFQAWRSGQLAMIHTLYLVSHLVIFAAGYLVLTNIDHGWLAINIWHNAQYIAFVWYFNNRTAQTEASPGLVHRFSIDGKVIAYVSLSLLASTAIYLSLQSTLALVLSPIIIFQAINFHHYVVDGKIWKIRKKSIQTTLGVNS